MSIERRRKERAIDAIVRDRIEEGYHPSFGEVVGEMASWAKKERPERAYTKKQWVYEGEVVERDDLVSFFGNVAHDVRDLKAVGIEQATRHLSLYEANRIEREKAEEKVNRIERKLKQVILSARAGIGEQVEVLRVHGEGQWREGESTAMLDIKEGNVRLHELPTDSEPILLASSAISVKALRKNYRHVSLTGPEQMFDGNLNTAWWHVLKTEDPGNGESRAGIQVDISFGQKKKVNHLSLSTIGEMSTECLVEYSADGVVYQTIPGRREAEFLTGEDVIRFTEVEAAHMRISLYKGRHDEQSSGEYHYYFAIRELYLSGQRYTKSGTAMTAPIILRDGVSRLAIETVSEEPVGTQLTYLVAEVDRLKAPRDWTWIPVSPSGGRDRRFGQSVSLSKEKEHIREYDRLEKSGEVLFGQDVYTLGRSDGRVEQIGENGTEREDVKLYRGVGQWKVERRYKPFNGDAPMRSDFSKVEKTKFIPFGNTLYLDRNIGDSDNLFRFTAAVLSDGDREQPLSVGVIYEDGGYKTRVASYSVYVNGKRMPFESDRYRLPLSGGWNVIELIFHVGDMQARVEFGPDEFPTELYLGQWDTVNERVVRGEVEPLTRMTRTALYQEVGSGDELAFANEGGKVYVYENDHNALYQLIYVQTNDSATEVAVRVDLERGEDAGMTPMLSEIVLKGSVG